MPKIKSATVSKKVTVSKLQMPKNIEPMLATLVNTPPLDEGWIFEIKWDGYRAMAFCDGKEISLQSRNQKSFDDKYYPIVEELKKWNIHAILDGEIVVIKNNGVASFSALQNWRSEADGELIYYVFDVLWYKGKNLLEEPLHIRKKLLDQIIPEEGDIRQSKGFDISAEKLLNVASKLGIEGIIAKQSDSLYESGTRSKQWQKIKIQKGQEVVIGGFTKNDDSKKPFSSLLVGVYDKGKFDFIGKVGTGFDNKAQKTLMNLFKPLISNKCPFSTIPDVNKPSRFRPNPPNARAFWLNPELVCEVNYLERTGDGAMRHASFKGLREDKKPKDVHAEIPIESNPVQPKNLPIKIISGQKKQRRTLLNFKEDTQVKIINGKELKFNNLSKVYWPDEGYTKRDLLNYYYQIAPFILPYLKNRPQSLNRFPNGITGKSFYQKDVTNSAPDWVKKYPYHTSEGENKNFLVVQDEEDLLWMANLGAIEMNPWNSTIKKPDFPDWCIIDIDPDKNNTFDQVVEVALATKKVLDTLNVESYCKTSGATGMHIYIPMGAKYTYDQCQLFGRLVATLVHKELPAFTSIERYTVNRKGKIYIDFLQNRPKATLAAPYSVRPKPQATVSTPLHWSEVKKGLLPTKFTLKNTIERVRAEGDLFKPVIGKGIYLEKILNSLPNDSVM